MVFQRLLLAAAGGALSAGQAMAQPIATEPAPIEVVQAPVPTAVSPPAAYRAIAPAGDIFSTLQASGEFATFLKVAAASNLITILKTQPNITLLAPTDAAFAALAPDLLASLMLPANQAQLQKLATYHLINARVESSRLRSRAATPVTSVAGWTLRLDGSGPVLKANDATLVQPDVMAANGVIHVIDKVLVPAAVSAALPRPPVPG